MKQLLLFRHSIKDGPMNTLGPKGTKLAREVGEWLRDTESIWPQKVFHGPLVRTEQTARAFVDGFFQHATVEAQPRFMPAIEEFGTDQLFAEMVAPDGFREKAKELGNYYALFELHDVDTLRGWTGHCASGIRRAFDMLEDGECGVAFGHSPCIELAVAGILKSTSSTDMPVEFTALSEMQGILLEQDDFGIIRPVRKIAMPAPEPAA
ncbi:MAG: hypothetical protein Q8P84_04250 [Deltaproteobacteria bacterium]|nr:hypothetical protein [Deltaproteobacteria bacterium]MDZ4244059.1 hypothetical protein [Candidatus Doudnabacteria bacterium]